MNLEWRTIASLRSNTPHFSSGKRKTNILKKTFRKEIRVQISANKRLIQYRGALYIFQFVNSCVCNTQNAMSNKFRFTPHNNTVQIA